MEPSAFLAKQMGVPAATPATQPPNFSELQSADTVIGAQLIGLAMLRYVLEVEPIASMDIDDLVPLMAPSLRATMSGRSGPGKACDCRPELVAPALVMPPW